jgi:hypothetical protein
MSNNGMYEENQTMKNLGGAGRHTGVSVVEEPMTVSSPKSKQAPLK